MPRIFVRVSRKFRFRYIFLSFFSFFEGLWNKISNRESGNVIVEMCVIDRYLKKRGVFYLFFFLFALKIEFNTNFLFVYIVLIWKISGIIFLKYKEWNVIVERCITGQYLKRTDV